MTSDILDLVRYLLQYGVRCVRHQEAEGVPPEHRKHIENLTFELVLVVIWLPLALDVRADNLESLTYSVRPLTTVRLELVKQLNAMCEQAFAPKNHGTCACT